jgi:hypothetical protein
MLLFFALSRYRLVEEGLRDIVLEKEPSLAKYEAEQKGKDAGVELQEDHRHPKGERNAAGGGTDNKGSEVDMRGTLQNGADGSGGGGGRTVVSGHHHHRQSSFPQHGSRGLNLLRQGTGDRESLDRGVVERTEASPSGKRGAEPGADRQATMPTSASGGGGGGASHPTPVTSASDLPEGSGVDGAGPLVATPRMTYKVMATLAMPATTAATLSTNMTPAAVAGNQHITDASAASSGRDGRGRSTKTGSVVMFRDNSGADEEEAQYQVSDLMDGWMDGWTNE